MKHSRVSALAASLLASSFLSSAVALADDDRPAVEPHYKHVLLISVDGMHAIDLKNWIASHPYSNFARLAAHGVQYPGAYTTGPSDSYPGMLAQVTGGTPKTAGLFYDDSYDRTEYPSKAFYTSQGKTDPGCVGPAGTEITNFEGSTSPTTSRPRSWPTTRQAERSAKSTRSSIPTTCSASSSTGSACRSSRMNMSATIRSSKSSRLPAAEPSG